MHLNENGARLEMLPFNVHTDLPVGLHPFASEQLSTCCGEGDLRHIHLTSLEINGLNAANYNCAQIRLKK